MTAPPIGRMGRISHKSPKGFLGLPPPRVNDEACISVFLPLVIYTSAI